MKRIRYWPLLAAAALFLLTAGATGAQEEGRVTFDAYELEGDQLLFTGETNTAIEGDTVFESVSYKNLDGVKIQTARHEYKEETLALESSRTLDSRTGETQQLNRQGTDVILRYRESAQDDEETETLEWSDDMLFSAVFVPRIRREWELLAEGGEIEFDLLIASRLDTVGFQINKTGEEELDGQTVFVFTADPSAWLIRQLVDPLRFYMAAEYPHRLLEYRGRTTVKTADGDDIDARIVYHHGN